VLKYEDGVGEKVPMLIHSVFAFVGNLGLAFYTGWKLTLVCIACVPIMTLVLTCVVRVSSTLTRREVEVYASAGSIAEEVLAGIRTVVAFAGQGKELRRYTESLDSTYANNVKKGLLSGLGLGVLWLSMYSNYGLSFWYGVTLILDERGLPPAEQTYNATTMIKVSLPSDPRLLPAHSRLPVRATITWLLLPLPSPSPSPRPDKKAPKPRKLVRTSCVTFMRIGRHCKPRSPIYPQSLQYSY
jgi:ABC-type multidrug transport system fused ATPase/permease subunit